ncbi:MULTISPECIES: IS3 family transposase [Paenibacillus]|uniref:IS3 family transposase n=1 Tax=Paenibacillus TaxID=44249 RepID=UPI0021AD9138|nr:MULTISPECIES: IS3 family transposase [Paenibacillus]
MSKKHFTMQEQDQLRRNPYVRNVSAKAITYTDAFKERFIQQHSQGTLPSEIFQEAGFPIDVLGATRIQKASNRWRTAFQEQGSAGLTDGRKHASGRPLNRELSLEEKYARLEAKMKWLEAENEFLKKARSPRKADEKKKIQLRTRQKFELIQQMMHTCSFQGKVHVLCAIAGVSRSGYYRYCSESARLHRQKQEQDDHKVKAIILKAYHYRRRNKGARQIKMTLALEYNVIYNLKRIRRIMQKYNIVCPIRKANPARRMAKATQEHRTCPNLLKRAFKPGIAGKVLLTDITYLTYGISKRAYLSTIKDAETNEILAYEVSASLGLDIAMESLKQLKKHRHLTSDALIHSDQGFHYTSPKFQKLVKQMGFNQSMSRRGNCWDNAPQESFFGHFKDETNFKTCMTLEEVKQEVKSYMIYYNHYRGQWNLNKLPPARYRRQLEAA